MKTKIRFVYHSPKGERGIGKAIVALTWFYALFYGKRKALRYNFSHEEVWLTSGLGVFEIKSMGYFGECFSSTTRGDADGVRFAPASEVIGKHPERWWYIECEVDTQRLRDATLIAEAFVGAKYDFLGILGFLNPFPIQAAGRWYCSEILDWFKWQAGIFYKRHKRVSPRRSAYLLAMKYGEPKPVKGKSDGYRS